MSNTVKVFVFLIFVIAFFAIRTLWYAGTFKVLSDFSDGKGELINGIVGAEDITIDHATGLALVSSTDRRKSNDQNNLKGAIYQLDFMSVPPTFKELTAGFDQKDFRPHGISLYIEPTDSTKWLFVVNHRLNGHFIEIFQYTDSTLIHSETIQHELILHPNDVVGVGKRSFYFTNDHDSDGGGMSRLEDFLLIGTGSVGYFDGETMTLLDEGIRYANGINIDHNREKLYVAACTDGSINVYNLNPFKKLQKIKCHSGIDNLEWDSDGNLWTGAHPKLLQFLSHSKDSLKRSPSQVLKIDVQDLNVPIVTQVYLNDGNPLSGSSVATVYKDRLLIGGVFDDGVLQVKMNK
jgi:arylesterase / paraoxonase